MDEKKDGHRAYQAERKAKVLRLAADLRNSDELLKDFSGTPDKISQKYGLQLTQEEVASLAAIAGTQELSGEALTAVSGGILTFFDNNCKCG